MKEMKRVGKMMLLVLGLWVGEASAVPGMEFLNRICSLTSKPMGGGELPTGVANPLIADGCHKGEGKMPGAEVKDGDAVPTLGTAYTVRYEGNTNAGTAKAILTGLPPYVGSVANVFLIAKRSVTLTSGTAR